MTTCSEHFQGGATMRCCSLCGAWYCDADNHGHTPQSCVDTLWAQYDRAQQELANVADRLRRARSRAVTAAEEAKP